MRLNHLYTTKSSRTLMEDERQPLEPSRYPPIQRHLTTESGTRVDMTSRLTELDELSRRNPADAYRQLRELCDKDLTTGLKSRVQYSQVMGEATDRMNTNGLPDYIVISADIDNTAHMNDKSGLGTKGVNSVISHIGELFENRFENAKDTDTYRTGGDSFAVSIYIGDSDMGRAQAIFVDAMSRCIWIANRLASTGVSNEGWPSERNVQPTMSFGISTSDEAANGILANIKSGGEGRKPLKYVIVIDSDLRHSLGLSVDDINRIKSQAPSGIDVVSSEESEFVYESKMPVDQVRLNEGALVVECSYRDMPGSRKKELGLFRESKNRYLKEPVGAVLIDEGRGVYGPLKEAYKYPS